MHVSVKLWSDEIYIEVEKGNLYKKMFYSRKLNKNKCMFEDDVDLYFDILHVMWAFVFLPTNLNSDCKINDFIYKIQPIWRFH